MSLYCDICFKSFATIQAFKSHKRSNNHLLKILQKENENFQQNKEILNKDIINQELKHENENDVKQDDYLSDNKSSSSIDLMNVEYENSFQEEVNKNMLF